MTLTAAMKTGAILEANGHAPDQIAKAVGVSTGTVKGWHEKDEYMAALEEASEQTAVELGPLVVEIRKRMAEAVLKGIATINDAMDAETKSDAPNWNARLQAAMTAINSFGKVVEPPKEKGEGGGGKGSAPQVAILTVSPEQAKQIVQQPERPALEGSAEEED